MCYILLQYILRSFQTLMVKISLYCIESMPQSLHMKHYLRIMIVQKKNKVISYIRHGNTIFVEEKLCSILFYQLLYFLKC